MVAALKRLSVGLLPMAVIFVLLLASLYVMGDAARHSARFERLYIWLLLFNTLALVFLAVLIGTKVYQAIRQVVHREPGSRLTLKLVVIFVVLALAPVSIVYYFSMKFLDEGIDSWFDVRVEKALEDALELSRTSLDLRTRQLTRQTEGLVDDLVDISESLAPLTLNDLRQRSGAVELTLIGSNNRIVASSIGDTLRRLPSLPSQEVFLVLAQRQTYAALEPVYDTGLYIRVVVAVPAPRPGEEGRILQAIYPVEGRMSALADSVQDAFSEYKEFAYLREPLKQSFAITLSLALLVSVLAAIWAAFYSAGRLVAPIRELAEGTRLVAAGEYHKRLPVSQRDELGFLVRSFNAMTATLAATRDEAERSRRLAESQRAYLQTVLQHLSSGVITLDHQGVLRTANTAAALILEADLDELAGRSLADIGHGNALVERFHEQIVPLIHREDHEWHAQITLFGTGGRKVLMCRGVALPAESGSRGGIVIVFDDITALLQAQRDAAWGEVARRLAHEIKNPLTPIQLSAERLQRKLLPHMDTDQARILQRATHTIVQQVEAMKKMVNAFGDYARTPQMAVTPLNLNALVREVADLYGSERRRLKLKLADDLPDIQADAGRMRQLLHNLIKNGLEALDGVKDPRLEIETRCVREARCTVVELSVRDNGPGLPEEFMPRLFEPYVTSKPKGTGLGLAIVKKIVEEHHGMVWAENRRKGGACITLRLPVSSGVVADREDAREAV
ncbi:two-component sensor histidine kinase [Thioalkalivibrio denitrificans]|uniref:histidine kinase n=1 Tax=Thioalkalivibrio denitrificans TaxID=108003 RepID=A0A1V3NU44_9GAMM|nr:ATP-binding protein [Thioalkalivibrio denitrificans]OOG28659.1 two-component sensor histidine kinase [Thioalkalivibrio denitrificans]